MNYILIKLLTTFIDFEFETLKKWIFKQRYLDLNILVIITSLDLTPKNLKPFERADDIQSTYYSNKGSNLRCI